MDSEDYLQQLDYANDSISNIVQYNFSTPTSSPKKSFKDSKLVFTDVSSNTNETEALTLETRTSGSTPSSNKSSTSSRNSMFSISPYARGSAAIGNHIFILYF